MQRYYGELLAEAGMKDTKDNYEAVDRAIKFVLDMEEIPEREHQREIARWISDPTAAKRMMVVRYLKDHA